MISLVIHFRSRKSIWKCHLCNSGNLSRTQCVKTNTESAFNKSVTSLNVYISWECYNTLQSQAESMAFSAGRSVGTMPKFIGKWPMAWTIVWLSDRQDEAWKHCALMYINNVLIVLNLTECMICILSVVGPSLVCDNSYNLEWDHQYFVVIVITFSVTFNSLWL